MIDKNIYRYEMECGDKVIFYSPIARKYLVCSSKQENNGQVVHALNRVLACYIPVERQPHVQSPEDYTLLTVLPNNTCNFSCSYCYSALGRNGAVLELEKMLSAVDYFIDSKGAGFTKKLTISFMGGGEPLLSWEVVKKGILYALEKVSESGLGINIRIITNGSVLTGEMLDFFVGHKIALSVSFEILKDIQNLQRKNYDLVKSNIKKLLSAGVDVQINSTITPANVDRMEQMMRILHSEYPSVTNVMFEPVTARSLFSSPEALSCFYEKYMDGFMLCREIGEVFGISVTSFAYLRTIFPIMRACPGEFCVTADGFVTGCYCVSSPKEKLLSRVSYGKVTGKGIDFDRDAYHALMSDNVFNKKECADCPVKWNCGGGCWYQYNSYPEAYRKVVCDFTREFVRRLVIYKVNKQLKGINRGALETGPYLVLEEVY